MVKVGVRVEGEAYGRGLRISQAACINGQYACMCLWRATCAIMCVRQERVYVQSAYA